MSDLDGRYAIVLDRWLEEYEDHWPLTALFETIDEARAMGAYDGAEPAPVPRSGFDAPAVEPTILLNEETLASEKGDIRRLQDRTDA